MANTGRADRTAAHAVKDQYRIIVIGCGTAAGFFTRFLARQDPSDDVLILERAQKPFKKLLLTGNGRCNYSNRSLDERQYLSLGTSAAWQKEAFAQVRALDLQQYLFEEGIPSRQDEYGRLFPYTNSAKTVAALLERGLAERGAALSCGSEVRAIAASRTGSFEVTWEKNGRSERAGAGVLVYAAGGPAYQAAGPEPFALLSALGHTIVPPRPGIVALKTAPSFLHGLAGLKIEAGIRFKDLFSRTGEVLLTAGGLSGPNVLYVSNLVSRYLGTETVFLHMDVLPDPSFTLEYFAALYRRSRGKRWEDVFGGVLPLAFLREFVRAHGRLFPQSDICSSAEELDRMYRALKGFSVQVTGTGPFTDAQVSLGGVMGDEIDPGTFCSRRVPGVYVLGEAIDYTGGCGGYNIHWCAATARAAARALGA